MSTTRKPHVAADQTALGALVSACDAALLPAIAEAFKLSEGTARRNLDGLVAQGLLDVRVGTRGANPIPRIYFTRTRAGQEALAEILEAYDR